MAETITHGAVLIGFWSLSTMNDEAKLDPEPLRNITDHTDHEKAQQVYRGTAKPYSDLDLAIKLRSNCWVKPCTSIKGLACIFCRNP